MVVVPPGVSVVSVIGGGGVGLRGLAGMNDAGTRESGKVQR